jgi:uncharacterized protein (TIGR04255 family)
MHNNYQFVSADGKWRVNLSSQFISLTCSRYSCWEDFAARLDKPLAAFIRIYRPAFFERVGLRYLNFISRKALNLEGVPFSELLAPCWVGPLAEEDVQEAGVSRCSVDTEMSIRGGCKVKIHAGPGRLKATNAKVPQDPEVKFVLDMDLVMNGNTPCTLAAAGLETLHAHANRIFEGALTDRVRQAMMPE